MRRHHNDEEDEGNEYRTRSHQIGCRKREMLRQHTAREDADTQTQVPSSEISRGSRAALRIRTEVNEQGVERGEGGTKAQAAAHCDQQESDGRVR